MRTNPNKNICYEYIMALTEEQRQRKNEMAKLNRAKKKSPVIEYESESDGAIEDDVKDEVQEVEKWKLKILK